MAKNTSVTLSTQFEEFVGKQVESDHYGSVSEAIRAGLPLLAEKEARLSLLRKALVEGEHCGTADYSLEGLIQELDRDDLK